MVVREVKKLRGSGYIVPFNMALRVRALSMQQVEAAELGFVVRLFGSQFLVVECCRVGKLLLLLPLEDPQFPDMRTSTHPSC